MANKYNFFWKLQFLFNNGFWPHEQQMAFDRFLDNIEKRIKK